MAADGVDGRSATRGSMGIVDAIGRIEGDTRAAG